MTPHCINVWPDEDLARENIYLISIIFVLYEEHTGNLFQNLIKNNLKNIIIPILTRGFCWVFSMRNCRRGLISENNLKQKGTWRDVGSSRSEFSRIKFWISKSSTFVKILFSEFFAVGKTFRNTLQQSGDVIFRSSHTIICPLSPHRFTHLFSNYLFKSLLCSSEGISLKHGFLCHNESSFVYYFNTNQRNIFLSQLFSGQKNSKIWKEHEKTFYSIKIYVHFSIDQWNELIHMPTLI